MGLNRPVSVHDRTKSHLDGVVIEVDHLNSLFGPEGSIAQNPRQTITPHEHSLGSFLLGEAMSLGIVGASRIAAGLHDIRERVFGSRPDVTPSVADPLEEVRRHPYFQD